MKRIFLSCSMALLSCLSAFAGDERFCDISGLDKGELVRAFYDYSRNKFYESENCEYIALIKTGYNRSQKAPHFALKFLETSNEINSGDIERIEEDGWKIDCLKGLKLSLDLSGDSLYTRVYDREYGQGAVKQVVLGLRKKLAQKNSN